MNARVLVDILLESAASAADQRGVYVFGPKLPPEGHCASSVENIISDLREFEVIPKTIGKQGASRNDFMAYLVDAGYTVIYKTDPKNIRVVGRVPAATDKEGERLARQFLNISDDDKVAHTAWPGSTVQELPVKNLFNANREKEKDETDQTATNPEDKASKIVQNVGGSAQAPKQSGIQAFAKSEGDYMPLNAPVEIGVDYMETQDGLTVDVVKPGSPASKYGMQAGDTIYGVGQFLSQGKHIGPFSISDGKEFAYVLRKIDHNAALPMHVKRGGSDIWVTVPVRRKGTGRRPQQLSMARRLFASKNKPTYKQTSMRLKPNAPEPVSKTGNVQANVSSLT